MCRERKEDHISVVHSRTFFSPHSLSVFFYRMRKLEISACDGGNDAVDDYIGSIEK